MKKKNPIAEELAAKLRKERAAHWKLMREYVREQMNRPRVKVVFGKERIVARVNDQSETVA